MAWRRMAIPKSLLLPDRQCQRPIHAQCRHRRAARRRQSNNPHALPPEMQPPPFAARIEQRCLLATLRIGRCLSGALPQRTRHTGQRQILQRGFAAGNNRPHVVHVKHRLLSRLRQPAKLTAIPRSPDDFAPQMAAELHASSVTMAQPLRAHPQQRQQLRQVHQACRFPFFAGRKRSSRVLPVQQLLQPPLHAFRQMEPGQITRHLDFDLNGLTHKTFRMLRGTAYTAAAGLSTLEVARPFVPFRVFRVFRGRPLLRRPLHASRRFPCIPQSALRIPHSFALHES